MVNSSLEDLSIQVLTEVSELQTETSDRFFTSPRKTSSVMRLRTVTRKQGRPSHPPERRQSDIPPVPICPGQLPKLQPFKLSMKPSPYRCKCMFIGGGGFVNTNVKSGCSSLLCVHRLRRKGSSELKGKIRAGRERTQGDRTSTPILLPLKARRMVISRSSMALPPHPGLNF